MIKFFRKIRQNLLLEGKTGKYLKYAIGEIILVVIGILIALQINNWNEEKKTIKKTNYLLSQVHKELAFNIDEANGVIRTYRNQDSIIFNVLNKKATYTDYKNNRKYSNIINLVPLAELKDNAFKNLINFENDLAQQQADIISKLIDLYEKNKRSVETSNELAIARLQKNALKIKDVHPWYYDYYVKREHTDAMVNYYLNDPIYLNDVTHYANVNLVGHNGVTLNFRNNAIELYKKLSNYLNIKQDSTIVKDLSNYEHYIGKYTDSINIVEVNKEKDNLIYIRRNISDPTDVARLILYPDTKTYFNVGRLFGKLTYHNNKVKELILSRGPNRREYKRID